MEFKYATSVSDLVLFLVYYVLFFFFFFYFKYHEGFKYHGALGKIVSSIDFAIVKEAFQTHSGV